jgi:hypothetical protein
MLSGCHRPMLITTVIFSCSGHFFFHRGQSSLPNWRDNGYRAELWDKPARSSNFVHGTCEGKAGAVDWRDRVSSVEVPACFCSRESDWRLLLGFGLCSIIAVSIAKIKRHRGLSYELPKRMMISDVVLGAIVMTLVIRAEKGPKATSKFKEVMSEYFRKESAS